MPTIYAFRTPHERAHAHVESTIRYFSFCRFTITSIVIAHLITECAKKSTSTSRPKFGTLQPNITCRPLKYFSFLLFRVFFSLEPYLASVFFLPLLLYLTFSPFSLWAECPFLPLSNLFWFNDSYSFHLVVVAEYFFSSSLYSLDLSNCSLTDTVWAHSCSIFLSLFLP